MENKYKFNKKEIIEIVSISCFGLILSNKKKELLKKIEENLKFVELKENGNKRATNN